MAIRTSQDYFLRMMEETAAVVARLRGMRGGGSVPEALEVARTSEDALLGPLAPAARAVDAATAAHIVGEPVRVAAWARLLFERAALLRECGDAAGAAAAGARAEALAAEARGRTEGTAVALVEAVLEGGEGVRPDAAS
jgi:hypothetical protein